MQLERLDIKGFKSFGEKITIHFDAGITGIVGPNGCGKSNVVDAIRWVLGEQRTRSLRSEKMEGVIFNGTKTRKQGQMAEVSLTFSNTKNILPTEFSQVSITRRYYRGGDSEYLLNGVTCRLKDITNLFLDTGIGPDSYAIIELKMVEDLLSDKDNSRRTLFEEAAGISKFKLRKKETLRRLEDTDKDLERVEDLLFEISKNLKALEKQAKQAEQYFVLKDEYKSASVALALYLLHHQASVQQRLAGQVSQAEQERSLLAAALMSTQAKVEQEKASLVQHEQLLASRQKALNEQVAGIRVGESEKKLKGERMTYLTDRQQQLRNQSQQDTLAVAQVQDAIANLEVLVAEAQQEVTAMEATTSADQEVVNAQRQKLAAAQQELAQRNQQLKQQQEQLYQSRKAVEIAQVQFTTLEQELAKSADESAAQSQTLQEFETKLNEVATKLSEEQARQLALKEADERLVMNIDDNLKETETLREQVAKLNRELDAAQNEYNLTKSLVDNLEGYPEAIKFLKKNTDWNAQATLLSDVLTCPEHYRVAIENYLEGYMNYYVVETEAQAMAAMALLSRSGKGRAHFFVLERFDAFKATPARLVPDARHTLELVECDRKYQKLVEWLLDDCYITDSAQLPPVEEGILLTASGSVVRRRYSYHGGSIGIFEGKRIGRAKNLEKLQTEIAKKSEKLATLKVQVATRQQELITLRQQRKQKDLELAQQTIGRLQQEQVALQTKREQLASLLGSASNKREAILERMASLQGEITTQSPVADELQLAQAATEQELRYWDALVTAESQKLEELSTQANKQQVLLAQRTASLAAQQKELKYRADELAGLHKRRERAAQELEKLDEEIKAVESKAVMNDEQLASLYAERTAIEEGVLEAERVYYQARNTIDQLEREARHVLSQRDMADQLIGNLKQQLAESNLSLQTVLERTRVEFEVELSEDELETYQPAPDASEEQLRQRVLTLRQKLDRMGPINPMAMESYNEMKERHDFITAQKADLVSAKDSLMSTISEIEEVARESFLTTFNTVREHFKRVFQSLFTDQDTCDLILEAPTQPLESPIDIIARPKGKRPQSISQLSSGEKTLTAISLLFSIYLIKPAPFCIFDEVDAPLDDANIDKFNNIIRKFSGESQFIIVTHNKRTMASTDVMYGVTMIEQGISKVIPVDFRMLQEEGV